MEILIVGLVLGLLALVGLAVKFSSEETGQQKKLDDAKSKKVSDLDAEIARRDMEFKKIKVDYQKLEDEFFKAKDDTDIFKKENTDMTQKVKQADKLKEELALVKDELKQKDAVLQQETIARQKLQGELSLQDAENEKTKKEIDRLNNELKAKIEMFDGLKGQFDELENELQRVRMGEQVKPPKAEPPKVEPPKVEPPKAEPLKAEPPKVEPPKAEPVSKKEEKPASLKEIAAPVKESKPQETPKKPADTFGLFQKHDEIPGFPSKQPGAKADAKQPVPSDMEFLKAVPPEKKEEPPKVLSADIAEGAFKLTNVNKPSSPASPQAPDAKKDKAKSKKETLIPGFHPKEEHPE